MISGKGFQVIRLFGIPITVSYTWFIIFALVAWTLAEGYFPAVVSGGSSASYWLMGSVSSLLLFVSVLLHELSHSLVAIRSGLPIRGITLHVFGGVAQLTGEPASPGAEFRIAIAGPICSILLAGAFQGLYVLSEEMGLSVAVGATLSWLALINLVLAAFNLVPGFPLDGGRLLRSILWRTKGNLRWATKVAARAGKMFAYVLMGLGFLQLLQGELIGGMWFIFIGFFLRQAAETGYQQLLLRQTLETLTVADVMTRDVITVPPDLPLDRFVDQYLWSHRVASFPVVRDDRVLGVVGLNRVREIPRQQWPDRRVGEAMQPLDDDLKTTPETDLFEAFTKMTDNNLGRLVVLDPLARLVGYLSLRDVAHILRLSGKEE